MNAMIGNRVRTPCVGICSTVFGDAVCRGCKRFVHEIIDWNGYTEDQKRLIDRRLQSFLAQVVESKLRVTNESLLKQQLENWQIPFQPAHSSLCWCYLLLKQAANQITDLSEFGIDVLAEYRDYPLEDLREAIDKEFFILSDAHYYRYMQPEYERKSGAELEIAGL